MRTSGYHTPGSGTRNTPEKYTLVHHPNRLRLGVGTDAAESLDLLAVLLGGEEVVQL